MKTRYTDRIDMPDITRNPEITQPEPNPAREVPPQPDPDVPVREQKSA